ncbi:MAG: 16S rRNA (guanine(966)-N(2))-methyltransferase RsmD [candidate division Zixibacteria bacterium]|nr:16S rRNA (guanine(966)-N(2))-methyltransferase RsmD [candidate division Zixibacteria bacterium]
MRINSGSLKGRKLSSPKKLKIRPPLDKLKQSVFNMLAGEVQDSKVLDLFAGTGSFGLEAVSRGAAQAVFVESSFKAYQLLKQNIGRLNASPQTTIINSRVSGAIHNLSEQGDSFKLIFVDPPFLEDLCQKTLDSLCRSNLLQEKSLIIIHHHQKEPVESKAEELKLVRRRKFGDNLVSIFLYSHQSHA